jgi:hypothetical protein
MHEHWSTCLSRSTGYVGTPPLGEQHDVRKRIAQGIVRCARSGRTTVGALTVAGERALVRIPRFDSAPCCSSRGY